MNRQSTKFQDTVLKDESSRSDSTKTTTGEELRTSTSNAVTNDALEPNPKGSSKAQQYRHERNDQSFLKTQKIGTWNVRSMNQGRPTNLTIIQIYAPTTEAEESTITKFYMELQEILEDVPKKDAILIIGDWNAKVGDTEAPGIV
ncbi:unnamed protein product, partial [Rotaria magnacalcarata]